ncbi:hypothetical protein HID58_066651 [Brassica napus]|uniref:DWNN domain-containing protein n=1 Tax=Brassica napus TaxID=3708 RepID=A0ABQ7ZG83_BRANA|nr:hypothetical protein HID58_066651 [Brassica napus]
MAFKSTGKATPHQQTGLSAYCVWPLYFLCFEFSEYLDESMLIPKNTSVLIHRVPGRPHVRLITAQEYILTDLLIPSALFSYLANRLESRIKWNMFKLKPAILMLLCRLQQNILNLSLGMIFTSSLLSKALIDTPTLDWQRMGERSFGNLRILYYYILQYWFVYLTGMESKTPPTGYICHRCNVAGHFIHHCPTNGDSNYNVKRVKPPTGIPKSMLVALIHCQVVQLQLLNQKSKDAFDKEMEGLPSTTHSVGEFPPEL